VLKLFFSITSDFLFLALLQKEKVLVSIQKENFRQHSESFFPYLRQVLEKAGFSLSDIQEVYYTSSFGSQTGLRISLSFVLTLQFLNSFVRFYHLDNLLFQVGQKKAISLIGIDLKKTKYYCAVYQNVKCLLEPQIITKNQLPQLKDKFPRFPIYKDFQGVDFLTNFQQLLSFFQLFKQISDAHFKTL